MSKIYVLGVGPGSPDYVLPIIEAKAGECAVLVGGQRNLHLFKRMGKEEITITTPIEAVISAIKGIYRQMQVGVLVSGDPGLYSFLSTLLKFFPREELAVYPGISSLQYLFARGALPWHDACITSLHGRRVEDLAELVQARNKVAFLTDAAFPVGEIARVLAEKGLGNKRCLVGENLSFPEEKISDLPLAQWVGYKAENLSVMVVYDE